MSTTNPPLPMGYSPVPAGKLANAVTYLQMLEKPMAEPRAAAPGLSLQRMRLADLDAYRALFRAVGEDWMWTSRIVMPDDELGRTIEDPAVEIYVLHQDGQPAGLLELDFRTEKEAEIVFFGLVKDAIGKGAGRYLMDQALSIAWSHPIERLWLHTCHFDHPGAVAFYARSGFTPYAFMVEVTDDPRLTGALPRTAAPHIPLLG